MRTTPLRLLVFAILVVCCQSITEKPIGEHIGENLAPSTRNIENGRGTSVENSLLLSLIARTTAKSVEENIGEHLVLPRGNIENGAENGAENGGENSLLLALIGRTTKKPYREHREENIALATENTENGGENNWLQTLLGFLFLLVMFGSCVGGLIWTCYRGCTSYHRLYTPCQDYTTARGATAPEVYKQLRKRWLIFEKERTHIVEKCGGQLPNRLHIDEVSWWSRQSQRFKELEDYTLECAQYFPTKEYSGEDVPSTTDLSVHFAAESEAIEVFASNVKNTLERLHEGRF